MDISVDIILLEQSVDMVLKHIRYNSSFAMPFSKKSIAFSWRIQFSPYMNILQVCECRIWIFLDTHSADDKMTTQL